MDQDTASAVAKAVADCNEGWHRKIEALSRDFGHRKWCVEQAVKAIEAAPVAAAPMPVAAIAESIHEFTMRPFAKGETG